MILISKNKLYVPDIHIIFCLTIIALALFCQPSYAAETDYLDELSAEAESTSSVPEQIEQNTERAANMKKMETLLQTEKPSTYKYYKKLSQPNKNLVFNYYVNDNSKPRMRIARLQKRVLDLYFE